MLLSPKFFALTAKPDMICLLPYQCLAISWLFSLTFFETCVILIAEQRGGI